MSTLRDKMLKMLKEKKKISKVANVADDVRQLATSFGQLQMVTPTIVNILDTLDLDGGQELQVKIQNVKILGQQFESALQDLLSQYQSELQQIDEARNSSNQ